MRSTSFSRLVEHTSVSVSVVCVVNAQATLPQSLIATPHHVWLVVALNHGECAGLYSFAAVVNVNLAVVNVLPLPALDGGYLLLLLIELFRQGKKLPQEVEATFMASGFLLLVSVGVLLIVKDTLAYLPK